jgi:hypothetical protein
MTFSLRAVSDDVNLVFTPSEVFTPSKAKPSKAKPSEPQYDSVTYRLA